MAAAVREARSAAVVSSSFRAFTCSNLVSGLRQEKRTHGVTGAAFSSIRLSAATGTRMRPANIDCWDVASPGRVVGGVSADAEDLGGFVDLDGSAFGRQRLPPP